MLWIVSILIEFYYALFERGKEYNRYFFKEAFLKEYQQQQLKCNVHINNNTNNLLLVCVSYCLLFIISVFLRTNQNGKWIGNREYNTRVKMTRGKLWATHEMNDKQAVVVIVWYLRIIFSV